MARRNSIQKRRARHAADLSREAALAKRKDARLERKIVAKEASALAETLGAFVHVSDAPAASASGVPPEACDGGDEEMDQGGEPMRPVSGGRVRKRNDARKKAAERRAKMRTRMESRMPRDVTMGEATLQDSEEIAPFRFENPLTSGGVAGGADEKATAVAVVGGTESNAVGLRGHDRKAGRVVKVRRKSAAKIRRQERKERSKKVMQMHTLAVIEAEGN